MQQLADFWCGWRFALFQLDMGSIESKHNYLMLLSSFKLATCFSPCSEPSSGHKMYDWGDYTVWRRFMSFQQNISSFESKHNYLMLLSSFKLATCFGPCTDPSSGHKIYDWGDYTAWIVNKIVWIIQIGYMFLKLNAISSFNFPMVYIGK